MGSFRDTTENEGYERIIFGINWILREAKNNSELVLEVAAGSGKIVGAKIEDLAKVYEGVEQKSRVKFALDTQHMWASGYDWVNNLDNIVENIDNVLGIENVRAIHLNGSKMELGSRRDRHENLGEGLIGQAAIKEILNLIPGTK